MKHADSCIFIKEQKQKYDLNMILKSSKANMWLYCLILGENFWIHTLKCMFYCIYI